MSIYCAVCDKDQECRIVTGQVIYPHRSDLHSLKFWQCPDCSGYVGAHKGTDYPLGIIVSKDVKRARVEIHKILDAPWKSGRIKRKTLYSHLSRALGYKYHTATIKTIEEARRVYVVIRGIVAGI